MAFWDALARAKGVAVAELLGGSCSPIAAYDSYGMVDITTDEPDILASLESGFRGLKIKLGAGSLEDDCASVAGVRATIGPDIALMVDYNQSLDPVEARRRIARLAEFDLYWVEEPVPAEDLRGHAQVRASSPVPIQTGENWWFPSGMANAVAAGASDYAMLDLMKIGGVSGWTHAMGLARSERTRARGNAHRALGRTSRRSRRNTRSPASTTQRRVNRKRPGLGHGVG
jgi:mandelate racemase